MPTVLADEKVKYVGDKVGGDDSNNEPKQKQGELLISVKTFMHESMCKIDFKAQAAAWSANPA
eukprot:1140250-Pelagomonas_calceolata.AAC.8